MRRSRVAKDPKEPGNGIVQLIDDALLQRDDRIVRDGDAFRTGAAFRDIAVADPGHVFQLTRAMLRVQQIHLERGGVHEMARADERVEHLIVA
jgi:hypothetical protein